MPSCGRGCRPVYDTHSGNSELVKVFEAILTDFVHDGAASADDAFEAAAVDGLIDLLRDCNGSVVLIVRFRGQIRTSFEDIDLQPTHILEKQ
jgi:hypothetical protein